MIPPRRFPGLALVTAALALTAGMSIPAMPGDPSLEDLDSHRPPHPPAPEPPPHPQPDRPPAPPPRAPIPQPVPTAPPAPIRQGARETARRRKQMARDAANRKVGAS